MANSKQTVCKPRTLTEVARMGKGHQSRDGHTRGDGNLETWKPEDLPEGRETVGCKWVFGIKHDHEGKISRYKARLVAQGYSLIRITSKRLRQQSDTIRFEQWSQSQPLKTWKFVD